MRFKPLVPISATFAAEGTARGTDPAPVAEIVTFRLRRDADAAAFTVAAGSMTPFLRSTGAALARTLSVDDTGLWTDHLTWTSMQAAKDFAAAMMQRPEAGPFMQHINADTVIMRHAPVRLTLQKE